MKRRISLGTAIMLSLLCVVTTFNITFVACQDNFNSRLSKFADMEKKYSKLAELDNVVRENYVGEYDSKQAIEYALKGYILGVGDKWSHYLTKEEFDDYKLDVMGELVGIGVGVAYDAETSSILILDVYENSPAQKSGLVIGDKIVAVEGKRVADTGYNVAVNNVRGQAGTNVNITYKSIATGEEVNKKITRALVKTKMVSSKMLDNNVGYIKISNFDIGSEKQFETELKSLLDNGAKALVFDVRFNPGGNVQSMSKMLDIIVPEGNIITLTSKDGESTVIKSNANELSIPMAVLTNENSISAAEFFAATLQEYGKAIIVGDKTSGKGYSQTQFELSDGSAIILSNNEYFTSQNKSLANTGITPDVAVSLSEEKLKKFYALDSSQDDQLQEAIKQVLK